MPDPNNPVNQNPSPPIAVPPVPAAPIVPTPPPPTTPPSDLDIPPMPGAEEIPKTDTAEVPKANADLLPPVVVTSSSSGRSPFSGGKVVAAILGVLVLVGGVGAGVFLTRQPQEIREKAAEIPAMCSTDSTDNCGGLLVGGSCTANQTSGTCQLATVETQQCYCKVVTIVEELSCQEIRAYKVNGSSADPANWTQLSSTDLTNLSAGDIIYLTARVKGTGLTSATFTVNGVTRSPVTALKPKASTDPSDVSEFYDIYTVPSGVTAFNIVATVK